MAKKKKLFIFKKQFWESLGNRIKGNTKCELCGKKYNNFAGLFGIGGVPLVQLCNDCLQK